MNLSIIIINYNNSKFLPQSIASAMSNNPFEIILVDDASTDNSIEVAEQYPVTVIANKQNCGPVKSRNIGASHATGDYLLFLDSDAVIEANYGPILLDFFESNPKAAVVSGKVLETSGERMWFNFGLDPHHLRDTIGSVFSYLIKWLPFQRIKNVSCHFTLNFVPDVVRKVDWVVEMGIMTRRDVFEQIGGFDEDYFMFFEGPDYCRAVRTSGFEVVYVPEAIIHHLGGHSHSGRRYSFFRASRKHYFKKWSTRR